MARRLGERFQPGETVEFRFGSAPGLGWLPGIVVRRAPPGLWVQDRDGKQWFVTNGRRIRSLEAGAGETHIAGDAQRVDAA